MHAREESDSRATRGRGVVAAYLVVALLTALAGPGAAVYAAEGDVAVVGTTAEAPEVSAVAVEPGPEDAVVAPEPIPEPIAAEDPVVLPVVPEQPADLLPAPADDVAAQPDLQPAAAAACPALEPRGVRLREPVDGTYTAANAYAMEEPVPGDFQICVDVFETGEGWFLSFRSNYPMEKVVVSAAAGSATFTLGGLYASSWLHAPSAEGATYPPACTVDFYFCPQEAPSGCLEIGKFWDADRDGVRDGSEQMLEGWEFVVHDASDAEVRRGKTDVDGGVRFTGLPVGSYHVVEIPQPGWTNVTALQQGVTIRAGEWSRLCFGNVPLTDAPEMGRLVVHKFDDADRDGSSDAGELPLSAWQFTVHDAQGAQVGALTTGSDGTASLDLAPGTYQVREVAQAGWTNTTPVVRDVLVTGGTDSDVWFGNARIVQPPSAEPFDPGTSPSLPFTGGEYAFLLGTALVTGAGGLLLRRRR